MVRTPSLPFKNTINFFPSIARPTNLPQLHSRFHGKRKSNETESIPTHITLPCGVGGIAPASNASREVPLVFKAILLFRRGKIGLSCNANANGNANANDYDDDKRRKPRQSKEIATGKRRKQEYLHRGSVPLVAENRIGQRPRFVGRARSRRVFRVFERHQLGSLFGRFRRRRRVLAGHFQQNGEGEHGGRGQHFASVHGWVFHRDG